MTDATVPSRAPGWPLAVVFLGLPIWWLLGLWQVMFLLMAIPMAVYLLAQRHVATPRGFWVWLLWLGWVLTGLMVLQVHAPGTVEGTSMGRYLTFGFRFSWYVAATIVALYVLNTRRILSTERVARLVAWFFVMLIGGGLLGVVVPTLAFPSLLQTVLPGALANQQFVHDLIHVQVAQVQTFLGEPHARPSAPFPYTNDWGLATAAALPFFVVAWWKRDRAWRVAMVGVSLVALFVIVSSVNRGMWVAILATVAFVLARSIALGRVRVLLGALPVIAVAAALVLFSPLGDLIQARLDNPHSDEGRANLGLQAVQSTASGSPIVGFGTTRDVAGNFASIAGGASPLCPHCEPPPLGTHGQLWLTLFGAGFVGALLFVTFLVGQLLRNLAARSPYSVAALCTLVVLTVTLPVYSSVGVALYLGFIAMGLLAREAQGRLPRLQSTVRPLLTHPLVITATAMVGGLSMMGVHSVLGSPTEASQRLLVPAADLVPVPGARPFTLDGEALIVKSDPVAKSVADSLGKDPQEVQDAIEIGAHPNTRVLIVKYLAEDPEEAMRGVELVSTAYLDERARLLTAANQSVTDRYEAHLDRLDVAFRQTASITDAAPGAGLSSASADLQEETLRAAEVLLDLSDSGVGRVLTPPTAMPSTDVGTVRIASGIALGLLLGVPSARAFHHRRLRLGRGSVRRLGLPLPVLARVSEQDFGTATHLVQSLLPVAGVVADPDSSRAVRLARLLDHDLDPRNLGGRRSVIVAEPRSRIGVVRRIFDQQIEAGLEPVGLIVCERNRRRA